MELNYKLFGQGPPLIILHGFMSMLDNWQTLGKRWADDYTVLLVDQRNHGKSPHMDSHNYASMADDLHEFMLQNGLYQAHILGHSMGGKTAMQFALQHTDMVDKLIVVDIAPKAYPGGHETIIKALNSFDPADIAERTDADTALAAYIDELGIRQFLLKNLSRRPEGGYRWKMNLPVLTRDYANILENIDLDDVLEQPSLFIRGANSNYVQDDDMVNILDHFLNARLETVANAGHWVHAEQPKVLQKLVSDFLAS